MTAMAKMPDKAFDLAIVDAPYRDENQPTQDMRKSGSMKTLTGRPSQEYWKGTKYLIRTLDPAQ